MTNRKTACIMHKTWFLCIFNPSEKGCSRVPNFLYTFFLNPSSADFPLKKGLEIGTMIAIDVFRSVSVPFFSGITTEEGFKKDTYT